ncbi:hypothetical protein DEH69_00860 [Streptomyces sp. PT12]|nr:hypothetical protein DEH69_00860 [Streptomyces sp. PT12]
MEDHLAALAAGLRVKVAGRLLDGNAGSALAEAGRAIVAARPAIIDRILAWTDSRVDTLVLLDRDPEPLEAARAEL